MSRLSRREKPGCRFGRMLADESGAAILIVLMALVGLTVLATGSLLISESDIRVTENMDSGMRAFYLAEAATNDFLGLNPTSVPATGTYSNTYGTATITATPLLNVDALLTLYRVTAVGSYPVPRGGVATRTLSRLVMFHAGGNNKVSAPGAVTSAGGLAISGNSGIVSGTDVANPLTCSSAGTDDIPGLTIPENSFTTNSDSTNISGNPPIDDSFPTQLEVAESMNIDWAEVLSGSSPPFDYTVTDVKDFPDLTGLGPNDWPVTVFDPSNPNKNKLALQESGQGLLIIPGNVELSGSFHWDGVILVGGSLIAGGGPSVTGAVMTGLNILLDGSPVPETDLGNGTIAFLYDSCYAHDAFQNLGVNPPVAAEKPGTWSEAM